MQPLSIRSRPVSLDDIVGQDDLVRPGSPLRRMMDPKAPAISVILYGPPGSGKTSIARALAHSAGVAFVELSATGASVTEVRKIIKQAKSDYIENRTPTILFIDEIHRFNRSQQDTLLPAVEDGTIRLIGATTENPSFSINSALVSRSMLITLNQLDAGDVETILTKAVEKNYADMSIESDVIRAVAQASSGDARQALTVLEALIYACSDEPLTLEKAKVLMPQTLQRYDRDGDQHYDIVSAFIKSMRGSDPDATLYWLARLLEGGEDPRFIARRIIVHASEDVGLADPSVLSIAVAAGQAVALIGMPEARLALAEAALAVALAPKSNAVIESVSRAIDLVKQTGSLPVPHHLRDAHYRDAKKVHGNGVGYLYPHDYPFHVVEQDYLPDGLSCSRLFVSDGIANEEVLLKRMDAVRQQGAKNRRGV